MTYLIISAPVAVCFAMKPQPGTLVTELDATPILSVLTRLPTRPSAAMIEYW